MSTDVVPDTSRRDLPQPDMVRRLLQALPALASLIAFAVALEVLRLEVRNVGWHDLTRALADTPRPRLGAALALTAVNYVVLTGYDLLAFRYIGRELPRARIAATAFVAYAIAHNVGFAALSGASVRYRFYARWGLSAEDLSRIVFSTALTFWVGLCALGGGTLLVAAAPPGWAPAAPMMRLTGVALVGLVLAYLAASAWRQAPLRLGGLTLPMPSASMAGMQLVLSAADWILAALVLYVLLPGGAPPLASFVSAFLVAILVGMVSHVPGGLGVFEGLMVVLLRPWLPAATLLPVFVVYRVVYYLVPLVLALVGLVGDEALRRRAHVARAARWLGDASERITPAILAAFTFLCGLVLLFSGATPASPGRLGMVHRILPLGVIETSHFLGSVTGAGLLVIAHGLARRLDAAYYLSTVLIVVGVVASLMKGGDIEEATMLLVVLAVLSVARPAFDRRAAFFETRFSGAWLAAMVGALGASLWLGLFAFKHVEYGSDLWWRFELAGDASRFLRGSVGAAMVILLVGLARLMAPAPHVVEPPSDDDLADAHRVIDTQPSTHANLVFLCDKAVLFSENRDGFVMYGVRGRSWVAMGDPVGPASARRDLIRAFLERVDDFGGTPVFYEVGAGGLHHYADFGLAFQKLGEEAHVDLRRFTTTGARGSKFRQALRRLEREGGSFRVIPATGVDAVLPALRRVSDDWLSRKSPGEKGFSLGFFDEAYLRRFPVAVIERAGVIEAFANVWPDVHRVELSIDLMRFARDAPKSGMEGLLVHLMLWGQQYGYAEFSLGMAPLSGFERSPVASLWQRAGGFVYRHGESLYGFQGLRAFKEKFEPRWEPRYLACRGGFGLPRVLADVSALVAGGYRQVFLR
jgi:phosphatidylglycerol lysyltransferase